MSGPDRKHIFGQAVGMDPKFTGPGQPFTLYGKDGASCTFWGEITPPIADDAGAVVQEIQFGRAELTGTVTVTFFNEELFGQLVAEQDARRAFIEKYTGLPVGPSDD
jgi:hypothetical protein